MGNLIMSKREVKLAKFLAQMDKGEITRKQAASEMGMSERSITKARRRYKERGIEGLVHRSRGRQNPRKWKDKERVIEIIKSDVRFADCGPTYMAEKIYELHNIKANRETLRQALIEHKMHLSKVVKVKHRERRERKAAFGVMVQLDPSIHDWFEERGIKGTLAVFADDATSHLWVQMIEIESLLPLLGSMRRYIEKYGRPQTIYVDNGTVFKVNTNNEDGVKITQFRRAMNELNIEMIFARSPQAKGRVERAHKTLQDRLVKDLRFANISTIEGVNKYLEEVYLPAHNNQFAVKPANPQNVHRSVDGFDLDFILAARYERVIQNDFVISFNTRLFQLAKDQPVRIKPKQTITVIEQPNGAIQLMFKGVYLSFSEIWQRPRQKKKPAARQNKSLSQAYHKPAADHPWRGNSSFCSHRKDE